MIGAAVGAWYGWRFGWIGLAVLVALVLVVGSFAPHDVHKAVNPSIILASECGYDGPARTAYLLNTAGPAPTYDVTCRDGVQIHWSGP